MISLEPGLILGVSLAMITSVIAPLTLSFATNRSQRRMKAQDWERQDKVASDVAESARLVLLHTDEVARQAKEAAALLLQYNRTADINSLKVQGQLREIHTLVNSNMTAAMQGELDSTIRELAGLREIVSLTEASNRKPSSDTIVAISTAESKISELRASLTDRKHQQIVVDVTSKNTDAVVAEMVAQPLVTESRDKRIADAQAALAEALKS